MESVEQMIKRLCPKGVKYEKLRDICEIRRGVRVVKKQLSDRDGYPVYQNSLTSLGMYQSSNRKSGTTFVICAGAAGEIGYCNTEFWAADDCSTVESDVLIDRFIYFYLMTKQSKLKSQVRKASVPRLSRDAIENLSIPVPPLEIQNRIVEVLDKMTTLTAELTAELEARKQQYEYYRNKLLTFNEVGGGIRQEKKDLCPNGVKFVKLGEVGKFYGGLSGKSKKDFIEGNAKFITYMNVYSNPSLCVDVNDKVLIKEGERQNTIQYGDLLFTGSSETPDECGMSSVLTTHVEENLYLNSFCFGYRFNDLTDINPHFLKHLFRSASLRKAIAKTANGVTRFNVSKKMFAEIEIPLPSMEEQARIVSILDRFEALTTDLQSGLPAEIEARRQQYEYYRNKLLAFEQSA